MIDNTNDCIERTEVEERDDGFKEMTTYYNNQIVRIETKFPNGYVEIEHFKYHPEYDNKEEEIQ